MSLIHFLSIFLHYSSVTDTQQVQRAPRRTRLNRLPVTIQYQNGSLQCVIHDLPLSH
jgi:hypothetical protein